MKRDLALPGRDRDADHAHRAQPKGYTLPLEASDVKQRRGYNPKRRILPEGATTPEELASYAQKTAYAGSKAHKRAPGDFGLGTVMSPRPGATLCDEAGVLDKAAASDLLRVGIEKGMVSKQMRNGFPQNIWAVNDNGMPFEAELQNELAGEYHGYPMQRDDDFRNLVLSEWNERQ